MAGMDLTKRGHACVRLTKEGRTLVIDPGVFSEEDAAAGADAVLITHEHADHFDPGRVRMALDTSPAAEVWAPRSVATQLSAAFPGRVHAVGHGDAFSAAGFALEAHGEWHAVIHPDIPRVTNVGYVVDGSLFHPGDALTLPERPVETLLLPIHAPWNKLSEVIDYVREVAPTRAVAVHDALLTQLAHPVYEQNLSPRGAGIGATEYTWLAPGESATV